MEQNTSERKWLSLAAEREALSRMEDAARTVDDFENVIKQWNHLDENRKRRERDHEIGRPREEMLHWTQGQDGEIRTILETVIPRPLEHEWWRQLIQGDFLDVIFDCPHELHELTSCPIVSGVLKTLNENQREVFYYYVIRQYSPQKIAKRRGQTDRNILKVYATLIAGLREKLYKRLLSKLENGLSLTSLQRQFVEEYRESKLKTGKVKMKKGKKKIAIDSDKCE